MDSNLDKLNQIKRWGVPKYRGTHYLIKFRIPVDTALYDHIKALKARYPEMILYTALTGFWLIGGTFPKSSNFAFEVKRYLKINHHEVRSNH